MIPFNIPLITGDERYYVEKAIQHKDLSGDGHFNQQSQGLLQKITGCPKVLLTSSCTHALEMCAILAGIQPGDEVIMPSFTFVSSANAFVLRGAKIVFVDIRPDTMNIDENLIEHAITKKTKAILVMHYAGVACEMDSIMTIARAYNLIVIEDAAHCIDAFYKNKHLGTIGHLGTLSFHSTKNIHCGEGGALLVNDKSYCERAEVIREKGTNRSAFLKGKIEKYSWVDMGSSYLMSELNAAFLYAQLLKLKEVTEKRKTLWIAYFEVLKNIGDQLKIPLIPENCHHNSHIFYIKSKSQDEREQLINFLKNKGIQSYFHYVPLHSAPAGKRFSKFPGEDRYTSKESQCILRLPIYPEIPVKDILYINEAISQFYEKEYA